MAFLLLAPAGADPGGSGRIPPAPAEGQPLPADGQVQLTLNGRNYTWSGAELRAMHGELRADRTILLGILQGLVAKDGQPASEFKPVFDFKKAGTAQGPTERGGPPRQQGDVAPGLLGSR